MTNVAIGKNSKIELKTAEQFRLMNEAGLVLSAALDVAVAAAEVGISTAELDAMFAAELAQANAKSNFLGYYGYPATICTSVNAQVVHGIPNECKLEDGDLVSIDGGAIIGGWHADSARTVIVGTADPADVELSKATEAAMWRGISAMATASRVGEIGDAIDDFVTEKYGIKFGIVEDYTGHGIGSAMHMDPDVLNYRSKHRGPKLRPGMALAIEPVLVRGDIASHTLDDDWTVVTDDGKRAAHWEHSVAVHDGGIWVLTAPDGGASKLAALGVTPAPLP
ncbi:methionine aminopeptidase [Renibacterium salmoninarum ATCC 33209]|uniref:Methionine aminopeptidase n=1 Tax=Renibacterium salmoninarum (strain ATCC 33209 / DSM 20767 / JCM 11484 / NBRC 15589 / NCIMB 2235) TaxID=288705 RepID=A9WSS1_RENSM|nr:methionine aminopeptidase [Renibacterium salmoninarum ATCC 33209]